MMMTIGLFILFFGAMMGDSDNLIIPLIVITIGATLTLIGQRRMNFDEEVDEDPEIIS